MLSKRKKLSIIALGSLFVAAILSSGIINAQQSQEQIVGLSISPAIYDTPIQPGTSQKIELNIKNTTDIALPIRAQANSLIPNDPEIDPEARSRFDASKWIFIDNSDFILEPGEESIVPATIIVPADVNPGGHYGQITFRVVTDILRSDNTSAQIVPEVSAGLFLTAPGDIEETMTLDTSNLNPGYVQKGSDRKLHFKLLNSGNIHQLPQPKITLLKDGKIIEQFILQPQIVLPNTIKTFEVDWKADVDWGEYEIQAELVYGSMGIPLASQVETFRVGPTWWQALLALPFIIIIVFVVAFKLAPKVYKLFKKSSRLKRTKKPKVTKDVEVGDYDAISQFLGSEDKKPPKYLTPLPPVEKQNVASSSAEIKDKVENEEVIKAATDKKVSEDIENIPINKGSSVTEYYSDDDKDKKTIIIQTSSTTIIRQEPSDDRDKKEIAVNKEDKDPKDTPKKKPIKISVKDDTEEVKKKKTKSTAKKTAKKPQTRGEKTAKSAPKKKAKNIKKSSKKKTKK